MISLILPFWMRQAAADKALASIAWLYRDLDLEVIVVDDGSAVPFVNLNPELNLKVVTLPKKDGPKSPVKCWNEGVKAASGDVVVISCVEVIHTEPVLGALADRVRSLGKKGYALAAAWCPEEERWHCHSSMHHPMAPEGTGLGFCAAIHKSFYEELGGFDEEFREGAGYEDIDWINRLVKAKAKWLLCDDLKVLHPKSMATIAWGAEKFAKNYEIYCRKWPKAPGTRKINFVCLNSGNYAGQGANYVNTLFDMVRRNMPESSVMQFWCLTDNPEGLHPQISVKELPPDLERWWGKLWMFKRGLFPDGSRMIFLDLDTVIVGGLNELIQYDGQFATLRDFGSRGLGPAVICWEAGEFAASIWEEWVAEGKPRLEGGDQAWMVNLNQGRFPRQIDILQDLYPGDFVSFKVHCKPMFPKGAKVVCFHGEPRPHNCTEEWVQNTWKIGGGTAAELVAACNTHHERIAQNIRSCLGRGIPTLGFAEPHDGHAVLVGGGPSLKDSLRELSWRAREGQTIFALNGAGKFLMEQGINPDHVVIVDARLENVDFVIPAHAFIASHCDPKVFDAASSITTFNVNQSGVPDALGEGEHILISTGSTVGLIAIGIAHVLGYRQFHLFGYDSSYTESHHAYPQPLNDKDAVIEAQAAGRKFKCAPWMVLQVQQFQSLASQLAEEGCVITVTGDGLLPHIARQMNQEAA